MRSEDVAASSLYGTCSISALPSELLRHHLHCNSCYCPSLGPTFFPVRGILFDKIPGANWLVPWHQDVTIAVAERVEADGFGPWSIKAGVHHVQPPADILENMVTVRIHLDPCTEANGALHVIPGSHAFGKIPESSIPAARQSSSVHICSVGAGGALLMRPLLLHASHPSKVPGHRRVIHLDFASVQLPPPMRWFVDGERTHDLPEPGLIEPTARQGA